MEMETQGMSWNLLLLLLRLRQIFQLKLNQLQNSLELFFPIYLRFLFYCERKNLWLDGDYESATHIVSNFGCKCLAGARQKKRTAKLQKVLRGNIFLRYIKCCHVHQIYIQFLLAHGNGTSWESLPSPTSDKLTNIFFIVAI